MSGTIKGSIAGFKKQAPLRKRPHNAISGAKQGFKSGVKKGSKTNENVKQWNVSKEFQVQNKSYWKLVCQKCFLSAFETRYTGKDPLETSRMVQSHRCGR